jgi:hypothetical protein
LCICCLILLALADVARWWTLDVVGVAIVGVG